MPSVSRSQRRFFGLVRKLQKGEIHPSKVSPEVRKATKSISPKDAEDFASTSEKDLPFKVKKEILAVLKEIRKPMMLNEEETNPVAKSFTQKGKYEDYIKRFVGMPMSPKELEAINNHKEIKPVKTDRNEIRYETTDDFGNNTTTVIKKLREGNQFVFTSFSKYAQLKAKDPAQSQEMDDVVVTKSLSFEDEIKGGAILSEFLKKLDL